MRQALRRVPLPDAVALLGLGVVAALAYPGTLRGDSAFFERDIANYWLPQVEAFVRSLAEGAPPVWNPCVSFGLPMWADPGYQVAYPPTWLNLALLPATYYKLFVLLHCFWAGAGVYVLARRQAVTPLGAFVAGALFCASGPFVSAASLYHHYASGAWIPWVLLALDRALELGSAGSALLLGATAAVQLVAGSGDVVMMTGLLATAWGVRFVARGPGMRGTRVRALVRVAAIGIAFGSALSAAQWLPTLDYMRLGSRLTLLPSNTMYWSVHPASVADLLVPRLISDLPLRPEIGALLFEAREPFLMGLYLGVPALGLALLGALAPSTGSRYFALLGFLFFLLASLGPHTPLLPFLLQFRPFSLFRYPVKYLFAAGFLWALLVALGLQAWQRDWGNRERRAAVLSLLGLLALAASTLVLAQRLTAAPDLLGSFLRSAEAPEAVATAVFRLRGTATLALSTALLLGIRIWRARPQPWSVVLLAGLAVTDVVGQAGTVNVLAPADLLAWKPPVVTALGPSPEHHRLYGESYSLRWLSQHFTPRPGQNPFTRWTLGAIDLVSAPAGCRWGLDGSYDGDFTGLTPRALTSLSAIIKSSKAPAFALRLLQAGSVDYVIALDTPVAAGLEPAGTYASVYTVPIRLYRVPETLPRAYVVDGVRVATEPESYALLVDPAFDPRREVILATTPATARAPTPGFQGSAAIVERRSDRVLIEAEANAPGYAVLVETYAPGWVATVDGAPAEVLRANAAFRAVSVPAGRHRLEMTYRPASVAWGLGITCAGLAFGLGYWEVSRRRQGGLV